MWKSVCVRRGAFTLIELLIVVAIIAILAAIAVPNFLEAQTRAKVSRVKSDARALTTALEAYAVDNNKYPPRQKYPTGFGILGFGDVLTRMEDMSRFTTPIAYITTLPEDVFEKNVAPPLNVLDYYSPDLVAHLVKAATLKDTEENGWLIWSVGPDGLLGQPGNQGHYPVKPSLVTGSTWKSEYDPTNGTISSGNISRFQKNGATADDAFRN